MANQVQQFFEGIVLKGVQGEKISLHCIKRLRGQLWSSKFQHVWGRMIKNDLFLNIKS